MTTELKIGSLHIDLSVSSVELDKGIREAMGELGKFATDASKLARNVALGVGAAIAGVATAITLAVHNSMEDFQKLGDAAQHMGISVEKLSALSYAAQATGVGFDTLSGALGTLGGKIKESLTKPISEAKLAFEALGIELQDDDGSWRKQVDVLSDIADEFAQYQDGASKSAMATKLFGDAGAALIPFLNKGSEGIRELEAEAKRLGVVFGEEVTVSAAKYRENLAHITAAQTAVWTNITHKLVPVFGEISQTILDATRNTEGMTQVTDALTVAFKAFYTVGAGVVGIIRTVGAAMQNVKEWLSSTDPEPLINKTLKDTWAIIKEQGKAISEVWGPNGIAASAGRFAAPMLAEAAKKGLMPWSENAEQLTKRLDEAKAALQAFVGTASEDFYSKQAAIDKAFADGVINNVERIKLSAEVAADAMRLVKDEAKAAFEELIKAPTETFTAKMEAARAALDNGTISLREYGRVTREINKENLQHWDALASSVSSALTTIFGKNKNAAIAAAVINTAQAITRNLSQYPMPFGGIMAALAAASGAAQIKAIKSTNMGGGGSAPSVKGGAGTGEATANLPVQQSLFVQGLNPSDLFRGGQVEELAKKLLQFQKDGGMVVFKGAT